MSEPTFDDEITILDLIDEDGTGLLDVGVIQAISANVSSYEALKWGQVIDEEGYWRGRPISLDSNTTNIIYVSKAGDDANNTGTNLYSSFLTIKRGLQECAAIFANTNTPTLVSVYPGIYVEDGNLVVPPRCAVTSAGGQYATEVHASDLCRSEFRNMFLINSGTYIQGFTFRNMEVDDFDDPNGGFAIAFQPGAKILRSPYIRDCGQVSNYDANEIGAPLDPANGNPLVGKGGGMLLADRAILNPNSIFPYMLAFGATPRSPNGLGYVAKNGGGINGISSLSIFQRAAFFALNGGQLTLNNSGTQFGDISMRAKGTTTVVQPASVINVSTLIANTAAADIIKDAANTSTANSINDMWQDLRTYNIQTNVGNNFISIVPGNTTVDLVASVPAAKIIQYSNLIDGMWSNLQSYVVATNSNTIIPAPLSTSVTLEANLTASNIIRTNSNVLITGMLSDLQANAPGSAVWSTTFEAFSRRDGRFLLDALADDIEDGTQTNSQAFVLEFFKSDMDYVFNESDANLFYSFAQSWEYLKKNISPLLSSYPTQQLMANGLIDMANTTFYNPDKDQNFGTAYQEFATKRDANNLIKAISLDVRYGTQNKTQAFALNFFKYNAAYLFPTYELPLFQHTWDYLQTELVDLLVDYPTQVAMVNSLFDDVLNSTITSPNILRFGTLSQEEIFTRRDAANLIRALSFDVRAGTQMVIKAYAQGFFNYDATYVMPSYFLKSYYRSYDFIEQELIGILADYPIQQNYVRELISLLKRTLKYPTKINFGSIVESLGHQFNNAGAGVNKNALPVNFRKPGSNRPVPFSVLQEDGGRVRWSGADELNNQYFAGGTQINGVTGKFEGRPFNIAVRQIARRISNSRGIF